MPPSHFRSSAQNIQHCFLPRLFWLPDVFPTNAFFLNKLAFFVPFCSLQTCFPTHYSLTLKAMSKSFVSM